MAYVKRRRNVKGDWVEKRATGTLEGAFVANGWLHIGVDMGEAIVDFRTINFADEDWLAAEMLVGETVTFIYADEDGGMQNLLKAYSLQQV